MVFKTPEVIYEDKHIFVFNKAGGISLLYDRRGSGCLWDWLTKEYAPQHGGWRPYLVHRLDKGSSGLWIVAKNQSAQSNLTRQFNKGEVEKIYLAGVWGKPPKIKDVIALPLEKGRKGKYRIAQPGSGYASITHYKMLWTNKRISLLEIRPETGRTHQIRVHLSAIGTPVIGDYLYGQGKEEITPPGCFMLHCGQISFFHPAPEDAEKRIFFQGAGGILGRVGFHAKLPEYFHIFPLHEIKNAKLWS